MDLLDPRFQKIRDYLNGQLSDGERQEVEQFLESDREAQEYCEQMQEQLFSEDIPREETALQRELAQQVLSRIDQRKKFQGSAATVAILAIAAVGVLSISPTDDTTQNLVFKPAKAQMLDMVARSYLLTDRSPVDPYEILLSSEREADADLSGK